MNYYIPVVFVPSYYPTQSYFPLTQELKQVQQHYYDSPHQQIQLQCPMYDQNQMLMIKNAQIPTCNLPEKTSSTCMNLRAPEFYPALKLQRQKQLNVNTFETTNTFQITNSQNMNQNSNQSCKANFNEYLQQLFHESILKTDLDQVVNNQNIDVNNDVDKIIEKVEVQPMCNVVEQEVQQTVQNSQQLSSILLQSRYWSEYSPSSIVSTDQFATFLNTLSRQNSFNPHQKFQNSDNSAFAFEYSNFLSNSYKQQQPQSVFNQDSLSNATVRQLLLLGDQQQQSLSSIVNTFDTHLVNQLLSNSATYQNVVPDLVTHSVSPVVCESEFTKVIINNPLQKQQQTNINNRQRLNSEDQGNKKCNSRSKKKNKRNKLKQKQQTQQQQQESDYQQQQQQQIPGNVAKRSHAFYENNDFRAQVLSVIERRIQKIQDQRF